MSTINIDKPRYDQTTYVGRAKHFFITTNPLNLLATGRKLNEAREIVKKQRAGVPTGLTDDQIWRAKHLYDSAFHPDTGEKMVMFGRMSAQVPCNMFITGCMLTFYKSTPAVIFWQWLNQSFNAVVNYTNRSGDKPVDAKRLGISYVAATSAAMATALGLNRVAPRFPPIVGRFVPFCAVAAANCLNIPLMRSSELSHGLTVSSPEGERYGTSVTAARTAIGLVVFSRIAMAMPSMFLTPVVMNKLEQTAWLKARPRFGGPIQVGIVGLFLVFATPLCCALFPQQATMSVSRLEPELQKLIKERGGPSTVTFNKGL